MMDLSELVASTERQDAGAELELLHPVTGKGTGMVLTIAGPDSLRQRKARHELEDALRGQMRGQKAIVSAQERDRLSTTMLASVIIDWKIEEEGEPLACTRANAIRLLEAGTWVREQVDEFAGSREPYMGTPENKEIAAELIAKADAEAKAKGGAK